MPFDCAQKQYRGVHALIASPRLAWVPMVERHHVKAGCRLPASFRLAVPPAFTTGPGASPPGRPQPSRAFSPRSCRASTSQLTLT